MAVNVNPPAINWPMKWVVDPDISPVLDEVNEIIFQLRNRTGGNDDSVSSTLESLASTIETLNSILIPITVTSSSVITSGNSLLICLSPLTVTLNSSPNDNEVLIMKNLSSGVVEVNGGGKNIDGSSSYKSVVINDSKTFKYSEEYGVWVII